MTIRWATPTFTKDDFALKQYYGRKTRHHKSLNQIYQTLCGAVDRQYAKALKAICTPMSHCNAGFGILLKKCNLTAKHGDIVSQVSIYFMKQKGTFPGFSNKLNLAVFELNERLGGAEDTQINTYLTSLDTLMSESSSQIDLVKAKAATLASGNPAVVKTWLAGWCVKTASESAASHTILRKLLEAYKPITEAGHAGLILKNSDPRFMAIRAKFMGREAVSLDAVTRAYTEYSAVLHSEGDTAPPLVGAVNSLSVKNLHQKKSKLPNDGTCEHPDHKGRCRHSSRDCRSQ